MVPCVNLSSRPVERLTNAAIEELADRDGYNPLHEAAFFFGLYLHGQRLEELRCDIDVPRELIRRWASDAELDESFRLYLTAVYAYRQQVLAIFEMLVAAERCNTLQN